MPRMAQISSNRRNRPMAHKLNRRDAVLLGGAAALSYAVPASAQSGAPIRIGYGMALTGGLAPHGKSGLLAQKIWGGDGNAKGGLLGRPGKLVDYDDQTNPAAGPGIYPQLIDLDQGEPVFGGVRHQCPGTSDAGDHAEEQGVHRAARPRREQRVQLSALFRDYPLRARSEAVVHQRLP